MNREDFKKRQKALEKLGVENEEAGKIKAEPSFLDYRDGYRLIAGYTLYFSVATVLFMGLSFGLYFTQVPQKAYATTTHGEVYEIEPFKITN